jgi:hypothetical protein
MPATAGKEEKQGRSIISYAINHISNSWDDNNSRDSMQQLRKWEKAGTTAASETTGTSQT